MSVRVEWVIAAVGCVVISVCVYCAYCAVVCCQGGCGAQMSTLHLQPFPVLHARPAGPSPRLTVSLDTAQQGAVDCLRGTTGRILDPGQTTDMSKNRDSILPSCQCDKRPDSCFSVFSFSFFHYEIHRGIWIKPPLLLLSKSLFLLLFLQCYIT